MNFSEYQKLAAQTAGAGEEGVQRLIIAALGLAGEAGEFANLIKKKTGHGHEIAEDKFAEELGDVLWYIAEAASILGIDLDEIAVGNIRKLKKRYPEGFSQERSINRD